RDVVCLGDPSERCWRILETFIRTEGRDFRNHKGSHDRDFLRGRLAGSDLDLVPPDRAQFSIVRKHLRWGEHSRSDVDDGSVALADPADSILFSRGARRIRAGARFHAADRGFHNVDCRTPGGTGTRTLIFRRSHKEIPKPTKKY